MKGFGMKAKARVGWAVVGWLSTALTVGAVVAADNSPPNSYAPVVIQEDFSATVAEMSARSPRSWTGR